MKLIIACVLAVAAIAAARPEGEYTDKYDNIDVEEVVANPRLLMPYVNCLLDKGKCTSEGKELKSHVKEALETHCEKCTPTQKEKTQIVFRHLINNEPEYWKQLQAKYDPQSKYTKKYEEELKKITA